MATITAIDGRPQGKAALQGGVNSLNAVPGAGAATAPVGTAIGSVPIP